VYLSIRNRPPAAVNGAAPEDSGGGAAARPGVRRSAVGSTVLLLGLTSLLIDISTEMSGSVIPLYVYTAFGGSPFALGITDGISQASGALLRLAGGLTADRTRQPKFVASVGYALTTASRFMLAVAGPSLAWIRAAVVIDRGGKGLRTPARDAMIADAAPAGGLGTAFGVHRAMDATGALLGPVLAFGILEANDGELRSVFVVSALVACVGLAVITLLVRAPAPVAPAPGTRQGYTFGQLVRVWRTPGLSSVAVLAGALGLFTIGDAFIYIFLQERVDLSVGTFPLLFVGTAGVYLLLSAPLGRLADRTGRMGILLVGHAVMAGTGFLLATSHGGMGLLVVVVGLLGVFYACTDGVLSALVGGLVPPASRATGLAAVQTVQALARLGGAVVFAFIWDDHGQRLAFKVFAAGLTVVVVATILVLGVDRRRWRRSVA
jgi:MFS family permease